MTKLTIEYEEVGALIPYENNSRTHSDEQVSQIASSITEFGWTNPILIDAERTVVAGHGRLLAAQKLGMNEVPVIILDYLTSDQRRALVIADNKITDNGGWNTKTLIAELKSLSEFNYETLGFNADEMDALLSDVYTPEYIPSFSDTQVGEKQLEQAATGMTAQIEGLKADKAQTATEVMCPYCAETFQYSGG